MVIRELVELLLEWLFSLVGLEGFAVGGIALGAVAIYYLHELGSVLVLVSRYAQLVAIVAAVVLVLFVAGSAFGVVEVGFVSSGIESTFDQIARFGH